MIKHSKHIIQIIMITLLIFFLASCNQSTSAVADSSSSVSKELKSEKHIGKAWTFSKTSVHGRNPLTITLQIAGTANNAPFLWSVAVTDSNRSSLFQVENNDRKIDKFFGDKGYISKCTGYQECKHRWYFEELPKFVENGLKIVDHSKKPVESWERDILVDLAGHYLEGQGLSKERRASVLNEMLGMLAGQFDSLHILEDPNTDGASYMYVPSIHRFVPYFHP